MNKLLLSALILTAASLLSSCQQDPQSANGGQNLPLRQGGGTTPAHPVITYSTGVSSHGKTYGAVGVMDTDGTHQTVVWTASTTGPTVGEPNWSPTGGTIAWINWNSGVYSILAIDVSVNSSGEAVGNNLRTIVSWPASDSVSVVHHAWCQQSTTSKIAFTLSHTNKSGSEANMVDLCTVPASGGTVTVLASRNAGSPDSGNLLLYCPTWSPDDSKIAALSSAGGGSQNSYLIFNSSTGALADSVPISIHPTNVVSPWSHTGMNQLAIATGPNFYIYYLEPSSGSTPTTNSIVGPWRTWSPNNSSIMYLTGVNGALKKVIPNTTTTATVLSSFSGTQINWRQN